jgi:hypothetical protein
LLWAIGQRKLGLCLGLSADDHIEKHFTMKKVNRFFMRAQNELKKTKGKLKPWYKFALIAVRILIFVVLYFRAPVEVLDRLDKITGIIDLIL